MMVWLNPAAFAALALLALPVLVHLLVRHRARRMPFPSLRFLRTTHTAAARLRLPSDLTLLAVRLVVIATAAIALAQPLLIAPRRLAAWNTRVARVVLLDRSESMKPLAAEGERVAAAEARSATFSFPLETTSLAAGFRKATTMLATAPPARREIVVVSDFQVGMLAPADLGSVPAEIGVRFIQLAGPVSEHLVPGMDVLTAAGSERQELSLSADETRIVRVVAQPPVAGLNLLAAATASDDLEKLRHAVTAAGTPAPSSVEPIAIAFAGAVLPESVQPLRSRWMLDTVLRLKHDPEILEACNETRAATAARQDNPWETVFSDRDGRPLVRVAANGSALLLDVAAPPAALVASTVVRGALAARRGSNARAEDEVRRMSSTELAALTRPPAPIRGDVRQLGGASDARWCWALVLILLSVEAIVRRHRHVGTQVAHSNAA